MSSYSANFSRLSLILSYALCTVSPKAETLPQAIQRILPSVVKIKVQRSEPVNEENELISIDSSGSGFVLDLNHHIVTNAHVIGNAKKIVVIDQNNKEYEATLIGKDEKTDVAVLEANNFNAPLLNEEINGSVEAGEKVFAIGSPYSLGHSVTYGIVSAVERFLPNYPYLRFIQSDAAINPGNSGGPLFDEYGYLIGMNSTYFSKQGNYTNIGFALPIYDVHRIADKLIEDKKIIRGYLGAELLISERYARKMGYQNAILVTRVKQASPAEKGGLKPGDLIIKLSNNEFKDGGEMYRALEQSKPKEILDITVNRNKEIINLTFSLDTIPQEIRESSNIGTNDNSEKLGIILKEKNNQLEVITTHSIAKIVGLSPNDLIVEINGNSIKTTNEFNNYLSKLKELEIAFLTIEREKKRFILPIGSKTALKAFNSNN